VLRWRVQSWVLEDIRWGDIGSLFEGATWRLCGRLDWRWDRCRRIRSVSSRHCQQAVKHGSPAAGAATGGYPAQSRHQPVSARPRTVEQRRTRRPRRRRFPVFPVQLVLFQITRRSAPLSTFGRRNAVTTSPQKPSVRGRTGHQRRRSGDVISASASLPDELPDLVEIRVALRVDGGRRLGAGV